VKMKQGVLNQINASVAIDATEYEFADWKDVLVFDYLIFFQMSGNKK